jgi:hypothetical protein
MRHIYTDLLGPFRADAYCSSKAIVVPREDTWPLVLFTFESHDVACAAFRAWEQESKTFAEKVRENLPLPPFPILPGGKFLPKRGEQ